MESTADHLIVIGRGRLIADASLEEFTRRAPAGWVDISSSETSRLAQLQAVLVWQATNAAVLNLAPSTLPDRQRRALAAAVPALHALAREVDRMADTPVTPAEPDAR